MSKKYLNKIIKKYNVDRNDFTQAIIKGSELINQLKNINLNYTGICGSFAKGTTISFNSELDILLSINSTNFDILPNIYNELYNYLINAGYNPYNKNISIGVMVDTYKFNLIPVCKDSQSRYRYVIYKAKTNSYIKTDLSKHTLHVEDSFRTSEIKLLKIWRELHHLNFPSLYLESVIIKCLKKCMYKDIESNFVEILSFLANNLQNTKFLDVDNSSNVISDDLSVYEKIRLANQAQISYQADAWEEVVW
ncbi:hypothetical protein [Dulcicalothrix desertica]|nr:hypothetical protein [Dulcicalothrix desertica]TWH62790.1 hypothetical protein CAL7102_00318 [Dulcicalothrix desertica PCC 7102]